MLTIATTRAANGDTTRLLYNHLGCTCCYPSFLYGVQLPSGRIHWYQTLSQAKASEHWPLWQI